MIPISQGLTGNTPYLTSSYIPSGQDPKTEFASIPGPHPQVCVHPHIFYGVADMSTGIE